MSGILSLVPGLSLVSRMLFKNRELKDNQLKNKYTGFKVVDSKVANVANDKDSTCKKLVGDEDSNTNKIKNLFENENDRKMFLERQKSEDGYYCDSPSYKFEVVRDPKIQGGVPTIKGTRWPVRDAAELGLNDGIEDTVKSFPTLNRDMVEKSIQYLKDNPNI